MRNPGRVVPHEKLAETVREDSFPAAIARMKVHIRRLRAKAEANPENPRFIVNKPGAGYLLA
jgi:two-component system KDP operon response regulator KdpE